MQEGSVKKIGDLLIEQHLITPAILEQALELQKKDYKPLGKILIQLGYISSEELHHVLAKQFGSLYINPKTFTVRNKQLLSLIPETTARKYNCFPFDMSQDELTLVIEDPLDTEAISDIAKSTGLRIRPVHAKHDAIIQVLDKIYAQKKDEPAISENLTDLSPMEQSDNLASATEQIEPNPPVLDETHSEPADIKPEQTERNENKQTQPATDNNIQRPWGNKPPVNPLKSADITGKTAAAELVKPETKSPVTILTFDNFVVGPSNQLAWAAAQNVVAQPGVGFNPLFIYGGVGLGKTHLANAIGNELLSRYPQAKIAYISIDVFIRELIEAYEHGEIKSFQTRYRDLDALLIDDIQFLSGQERTQEEFFYVFEQLYRSNGQMVITSDRLPRQIDQLADRLRSRFEGGLMVDIQPPDLETRIAIFKRKTAARGLEISDEIARAVAIRLPVNIRELEGLANRVLAQSQLMREKITLELVEDILNTVAPHNLTDKQSIAPVITRPGTLPSRGFR